MYISFSEFMLYSYYNQFMVEGLPLIVDYPPQSSPVMWVVKILFCFNLIITYPLMMYPANVAIESYIFSSWKKGRQRTCFKNISRAVIVTGTIVLSLTVYNQITDLLAIVGSLSCTPIAFILPALFHYKACAETRCQKAFDLSLVVLASFIMVFCTIYAAIAWKNK